MQLEVESMKGLKPRKSIAPWLQSCPEPSHHSELAIISSNEEMLNEFEHVSR